MCVCTCARIHMLCQDFRGFAYWGFQQGKFEMRWYGCKILSCSYNFKKIKDFKLYSKAFTICSSNQIRGTVQNSNRSIVTSNIFCFYLNSWASSSFFLKFQLNQINKDTEVERNGYLLWTNNSHLKSNYMPQTLAELL